MTIIAYRQGDLLTCPQSIIAHGCNLQGVMGSGVAKGIKEKFPWAFHDYYASVSSGLIKLGDIIVSGQNGAKTVINCITQEFYGREGIRYVSYDAIDECFRNINSRRQERLMAIPRIGAGLGGGDWEVIEVIINRATPTTDIVVYQEFPPE